MNPACSATRRQITVLGINSRFGNAVSFLLKQSPIANRLVLYDERNTEVAHDLSAISTTCKVVVYSGEEQLRCAVKNSDLILIGDKEDPGPNVDETIGKAAPDVIKYAEAISCSAPNAIVLVAASPVNSMLSLFSEVQIRNGTFDCDRVMGVTSVDTMRASTVLARHMNMDPEKVHLPVIGGSSPDTRIPLFSQSRPAVTVCKADLRKMTRMIKMTECELFKLLNRGDALNKAYATVRLIDSVMSALRGQRNISEIVLSRTCLVPDVDYFSLPVILGPRGIAHRFPIPTLTERENILLEHAIKFIQVDKQKAVDIVCKRARSNQCRTPEKTKEYCDLLECNKKGIFVGALLDKLRIRKEACKPKLEYLLMCKNNDLVYPPDCEPCLSPKRIKFVEPELFPNDGCCPVKLPCPPSPPKRGLTVITPKKPKCKIVSSPCPYPPVVKSPKTCNICEKGSPCEHYEGCKNLYGDTKCCGKVLSPSDNKSILTSKSEQPETQLPPKESNAMLAGVNDQLAVGQQINSFVQTPDKLQCSPMPQSNTCELPQSTTANHSMPLTTLDNTNVKSVETSPCVIFNSPSMVSETRCPYGMSTNSPASGDNHTSPVSERNSEGNISHFGQAVTNGSATESDLISHSKQADPKQVDLDRHTTVHSYSVPMKSPAHQNPKAKPNQEMLIQPGSKSFNPDAKNGPLSSSYSNAVCHDIPLPRNIDQSIDQCLSKICLIEINPGKLSTPTPIENNLRSTATEPVMAMGVSQLKTAEQYDIHSKSPAKAHETHPQVQNNSYNMSASQHAVAPITLGATNTDVPVQDTSKIQKTRCEYEKTSFDGSVQQASTNTPSGTFNYTGGLGIPSNQLERDPNNPFLSFNPWSAQREEQYYNELSATNAQLKNKSFKEKVSTPTEVTQNPNDKETCEMQKPAVAENMEHENGASKENKSGNDSSVLNTTGPEIGTVSNITLSCTSDVRTDILKSDGPTANENEKVMKDLKIPETVSIPCGTEDQNGCQENKIVQEEFPEDPGTNAVVSDMRMSENIRTSIENFKMHNNKSNIEKTKILGFGQIIKTLIPSTKFSKRTERKSNNKTKPSRKLYVETHSNLETTDPKGKKGSVLTLPIVSPRDNKDCTVNQTKNNSSGSKTSDVHSEVSKIAFIRSRVQEALKSIMYPPTYSQKPADRLAKQEKHVERILQEKLRRASKAIKYDLREVRKVDSAYEPVSQKLYAPKCPSRLIFGNHPDSRVITFNNVREFEAPKVKTEKVASAGERMPCSDVVDQNVVSKKGKESTEKSLIVREEQLPSDIQKTNVTDSDEINSAVHPRAPDVHGSDYWTHRPHSYAYQAPPPTSNQEYVQNQPVPIPLKGTTAQPTLNNVYLKHILGQRTLREKRTEANFDHLESVIRERSKKVMTPGSLRSARVDDPKYGLTSPNRIRSNR